VQLQVQDWQTNHQSLDLSVVQVQRQHRKIRLNSAENDEIQVEVQDDQTTI